MASPLLSFVIPTWNRSGKLLSLLQSLLSVKDPRFEVVVSDDGSREEHFAPLKEFASREPRLHVFRNEQNLGMVGNWNEAIRRSGGDWICFFCDDDSVIDGTVERLLLILDEPLSPRLILQDSRLDVEFVDYPPGPETASKLHLPYVSGNLWHRSLTAHLGGFDEQLLYSPDAEFWFRLAASFSVRVYRDGFARYNDHGENYAYTTWMKPDFLDQVALVTRLSFQHQHPGRDEQALLLAVSSGITSTIQTILSLTKQDKSKRAIYLKYRKIALKRAWVSGELGAFLWTGIHEGFLHRFRLALGYLKKSLKRLGNSLLGVNRP